MLHLPFSTRPILTAIFWVACAAWILPEVAVWRVKRSTDSSQARDHGSLNLIVIRWWVGIAMAVLMSSLLPQAAISWERTSVFLVGICFVLTGVTLRWYSAAVLGKYFTFDVAIQGGQTLIEVTLPLCPPSFIQRCAFESVGIRFGARKLGGARSLSFLLGICVFLSHPN
jgi:hypothetical protein